MKIRISKLALASGLCLALTACPTPAQIAKAPISASPVQDVSAAAGPAGAQTVKDLQDAEWNLDSAIAVGALPAADPADACLHQVLTAAGAETNQTPAKSFVPRTGSLAADGAILYIRAQQGLALGAQGVSGLVPAQCQALVGKFVIDGLTAKVKVAAAISAIAAVIPK